MPWLATWVGCLTVSMRIADVTLAFPAIVLAMAITVVLGPSLRNATIALILVRWSDWAWLMRGQVLSAKNNEYVLAARCLGCSPTRVLIRHIFPNVIAPLLVKASLDIGAIILFIAVLIVVIIIHELGHFVTAKAAGVKVLEFAIGFPPRLFAIKRGETEYSINVIPLGAFVKTAGENDPTVPDSLAGKSPWVRMGVYFAGPLANGLLAFILFVVFFMIPVQVVVGSELGAEIAQVREGYPAQEAGIQKGDILLEIDGIEIHRSEDMRRAIEERTGEEITLLLQRDEEEISRSLTPAVDPDTGREIIGISYRWPSPYITESHRYSFWEANRFSGKIFASTPTLLKDAIIHNPSDAVTGPVGAGQIAVEVLKHDLSNIVFFTALISLGIGMFNMFPIPPLDGGGIVEAALEGIRRGKRLSPQAIRLVYVTGVALLLTFFVMITYNDILRLIRGESFFP